MSDMSTYSWFKFPELRVVEPREDSDIENLQSQAQDDSI